MLLASCAAACHYATSGLEKAAALHNGILGFPFGIGLGKKNAPLQPVQELQVPKLVVQCLALALFDSSAKP